MNRKKSGKGVIKNILSVIFINRRIADDILSEFTKFISRREGNRTH